MAEKLTEKLVKAQNIDFVEQFGLGIKSLKEMLSVQRVMKLTSGSTIDTYTSKVTLEDGSVEKGDIIPLSKVEITKGTPINLEFKKYRKAVAVEDIQTYGFDQAISKTDNKLLRQIQKNIKSGFFAQLETGTGEAEGVGLQGALAQGWGKVQTLFEDESVTTIAFVNPLDVANYLSKANITIQNAFGLNYVKNFLGTDIVVISSQIEAKKIYVTADENLVLAYAVVNGGEIGKAFDFTTDETGIVGVTHDINKQALTAETVALTGSVLFAERLDGIVKVTIQEASEV